MGDGDDRIWGPDAPEIPSVAPLLPPPPGAPLDIEATVVQRGGGRGRLALGAIAAIALLAGGLAILARSGDDPDPDATLRAAQAIVDDSDSFHFELLAVSRVVTGDPEGAGSDTTTRSLTTGAVAAADRWHLVEDPGDELGIDMEPFEIIRVGDTAYFTDPFSEDIDVPGPAWVASPFEGTDMMMDVDQIASMYEDMESVDEEAGIDGSFDDGFLLDFVMMVYLSDATAQPTSITRLITDATAPAVEEQLADGGVRLRVRLAPIPELAEVAKDPIPAVDLMLDLNADDEPVLAKFTAEAGTASSNVEVRFSDWGTDIAIEPPAEDEVDRTPWLSEEAIAALDPALLVAPAELPDSLALSSAVVYGDESVDVPDGSSCENLDLTYSSEEAMASFEDIEDLSGEALDDLFADMEYLNVTVESTSCAQEYDDTPFDSELGGLPARGVEEGYAEVQVGEAVVAISSSYESDVLGPLVASIRPVTVDELVSSVPDWATSAAGFGGFGGFPGIGGFGGFGVGL